MSRGLAMLVVGAALSAITLSAARVEGRPEKVLGASIGRTFTAVFTLEGCVTTPRLAGTAFRVSDSISGTFDEAFRNAEIIGNDVIACDGQSYYLVTILNGANQVVWRNEYLVTGETWNIEKAEPLKAKPAPVPVNQKMLARERHKAEAMADQAVRQSDWQQEQGAKRDREEATRQRCNELVKGPAVQLSPADAALARTCRSLGYTN